VFAAVMESRPVYRDLQLAVVLFGIALIAFHLSFAATGHCIMRDQHMNTAVQYAKGRIDLLHPMVPGVNANSVPTILELPIWQAATALLMKTFGSRWYGWGNVVSLLFLCSSFWPLIALARKLVSPRAAWWAALFYVTQPLTFLWGGMAEVSGAAAAFSLWFCYLAVQSFDSKNGLWSLAAGAAGILAALTKAPFFMAAGLMALFYVLREHRKSPEAWLKLSLVGFVSCLAFVLWTRHANHYAEMAEFPYYDLRIKGGSNFEWFFGGLSARLNPRLWMKGAWRFPIALFGSVSLALLPLLGWPNRRAGVVRWWVAAGVLTTVVFTSVVLNHWHYYMIFAAPVAFLAAIAAEELEGAVRSTFGRGSVAWFLLLIAILSAALVQGLERMHVRLYLDTFFAEQGETIKRHSAPTDKLVVLGFDWGTPFLQADRDGLMSPDLNVINDPAKLERLKQLGFTRLVLMNRSPLVVATTMATGNYFERRYVLTEKIPPVARNWLVLFSSEDLIIFEIPR
jgi:hypothetical protein